LNEEAWFHVHLLLRSQGALDMKFSSPAASASRQSNSRRRMSDLEPLRIVVLILF